jgi:glycosyltransferase involved in cell wall biosynthesis
MRVLMLSWEYPPHVAGGLGRHVAELAPALAQQGVELHIVTPITHALEALTTVENGTIIHRVLAPIVSVEAVDIYSQALEANEMIAEYARSLPGTHGPFDLIHVHDWLTGFAGIALKNDWHCPLVTTIHATERGRGRGYLSNSLQWSIDAAERDLIQQSQQIIVCSHYMFNEIQYLFQIPATKLEVIPNAVNLDEVRNSHNPAERATVRARFAAPDDQIVFTISRLVYEKGVHQLVQAAPRVLAECPQARILIAGKGPEAKNLKQQVVGLNVADRVNFIGFITDAERNMLFREAACAIFPSLYEPFGIVALEAMAFKCPVIVSEVGGFSEMVKHTITGITVYPDNPDSIAWGITHMLNHPERAREYAENARRSIELVFNWPRIAWLTINLYRRIAKSI